MTREEAINELNYIKESFAKCELSYEALDMAIKALEEPQWIPCSERLPEEGREVLVCLTDWQTGDQKRVVSYRIDFNMWHGYGRYNEKCVAWMPLPEPWKDGDAEFYSTRNKDHTWDYAHSLIINAPTIEQESQWIPCSERLPNTNGIYIVTRSISDGFEYQNITDACYFDGSNTWHDDTRINHERKYLADVLAWMPMPEPWRGDEE